jgi:hypothetical protein
MNAEQKFYNAIRDHLILQDGDKFLRLSEKDQNNIILATIRGYIEIMKKEK